MKGDRREIRWKMSTKENKSRGCTYGGRVTRGKLTIGSTIGAHERNIILRRTHDRKLDAWKQPRWAMVEEPFIDQRERPSCAGSGKTSRLIERRSQGNPDQ
jgi:hypothetical protein